MKNEFNIQIEQAVLDDLKNRLANTRWTDDIDKTGWEYGTNKTYLRELCAYWQNEFDWKKQEEQLNRFHHYKTSVDNFGLHFIHERGKGANAIPLLMIHGWPDSFVRFLKIIPLLTKVDEKGVCFDVIV